MIIFLISLLLSTSPLIFSPSRISLINSMADMLKKAIRYAKIAIIVIITASALFVSARLAFTYCWNLLSPTLLGAWITTQLIIVILWKLSDNHPVGNPQLGGEELPQAPPSVVEETSLESSSETAVGGCPLEVDPYPTASTTKSGDPQLKQSSPDSVEKKQKVLKRTVKLPPPEQEEKIKEEEEEEDRDSMDATWRAIVERGATPVRRYLRKSDTWEGSPRVDTLKRATAMASQPELRKSATFREAAPTVAIGAAARWRGREALGIGREELFGRVEAFIKMQHENLKLQRMESEQRRSMGMANHVY